MIDINLVPENLRKKRRVQPVVIQEEVQSGLPKETIFTILGVFAGLLVAAVLVFQYYVSRQIAQRNELRQQMEAINKDKKNIENIIKEKKDLDGRVKTFEKVVGTQTVVWAEKLNEISDNLPRSIWLTKVALESDSLIIEGSAVSKLKTEISDIHSLTGKLKSSDIFMSNLKDLELEQIKTRPVNALSVADFRIKAVLIKEIDKTKKKNGKK